MVALPTFHQATTLDKVDEQLREKAAREEPRTYLGFSLIGDDCERKIWYCVQGAPKNAKDVKNIRCIQDGHAGEAMMAERLRMVPGIELHTHTEDGEQYRFVDLDGKYSGGMDGAIRGLVEAPKTWHVWEHKQVGEKGYAELQKLKMKYDEKEVLEKWNYQYYCQAVLYMKYSGMHRHYMTVATPGGRDYTSIRTESNSNLADNLRAKAIRILGTANAPERIAKMSSYYKCKFCDYRGVCYDQHSR